MAKVRIDPFGFSYIPLYIKKSDEPDMLYLPYKVDTGANRTTISKNWLNKLGFSDSWVKRTGILLEGESKPSVATSVPIDDCYAITMPEINVGGFVGYNWPFLVSLDSSIQFRLLLGVDTMQFFNWSFNYESGVCQFDLISGKRSMLFNQSKQFIHEVDEV